MGVCEGFLTSDTKRKFCSRLSVRNVTGWNPGEEVPRIKMGLLVRQTIGTPQIPIPFAKKQSTINKTNKIVVVLVNYGN